MISHPPPPAQPEAPRIPRSGPGNHRRADRVGPWRDNRVGVVMAEDGRRTPLRFATFLAPNMLPVYRFLADRIGRRLGRRCELVVGRSFDQFERGEADLGVLCGLPYVWLAARRPPPVEPLAAPVLAGARYGGRPVYYSDVIVGRDSPISRLEELAGRSWAYNEPASHSGHTVTLYSLVTMGARPGFLGQVVEAGFHQRAIRLVGTGAVDAAAVDSQVLASSSATIHGWPTGCGSSAPSGRRPSSRWWRPAASPPLSRPRPGRSWSSWLATRRPGRCSPTGSSTGSPRWTTPPTTTSGPCWRPSRRPAGPASPRRRPGPDHARRRAWFACRRAGEIDTLVDAQSPVAERLGAGG
jgi:ABC transporter, phosphonate, periplasmic substrate-binding protein